MIHKKHTRQMLAVMLADARAPAVLAVAPLAVMRADARAPAVLADACSLPVCSGPDIKGDRGGGFYSVLYVFFSTSCSTDILFYCTFLMLRRC